MNYRDFYKKEAMSAQLKDAPSLPNVDQHELEMGIKHEKEHTKDEKVARVIAMQHLKENPHYYSELNKSGIGECGVMGLDADGGVPKFADGSLAAPRGRGIVSIAKIVEPGKALGSGEMASGNLSGYKEVGAHIEDKEPITAGGKEADKDMASKSVGGNVVPGEGQKQGGPNTKGSIAGTPKIGEGESEEADMGLFEGKDKARSFVKDIIHEVMDELKAENRFASMNPDEREAQTPSGQAGMIHKTSTICPRCNGSGEGMADGTKCLDCKGSGDVRGWGKPKSLPSRRDPDYDPRDQGVDECFEAGPQYKVANRQYRVSDDDIAHSRQQTPEMTETAPPGFEPGEKHGHVLQKLKKQYGKSSPKTYATAWAIYNKMEEGAIQFDEANKKWLKTEAGGAAVQHKSYRTANDAPQFPKNRHEGDVD